jgi:Holliday junction resolvase-like predicted endonuclease
MGCWIMTGIGLWQVDNGSPARLLPSEVGLEAHLEGWIEQDPAMLEHGLVIVGRQIVTEGGRLDLLALDPQGRWVLIEIKRSELRREVLCQAIDYAACLKQLDTAQLRTRCDEYLRQRGSDTIDQLLADRGRSIGDNEPIELIIYLVGTRMDRGLERMVDYLGAESNFVIRVVTFSVFGESSGKMLLAREIIEGESQPAVVKGRAIRDTDLESLQKLAMENGIGEVFDVLVKAGQDAGLHARLWKTSIMFAPPSNRTRCAFTVWTGRRAEPGHARVYIAPEVFEQYLGIPQTNVAAILGSGEGYTDMNIESAKMFAKQVAELMDAYHEP